MTLTGFTTYCGPDVGRGEPKPSGAFCLDAAWVIYRGAPAGSAFVTLQPSFEPFYATCLCPTDCAPQGWTRVEMSGSQDLAVLRGLLNDGCYSSTWLIHADGYCPHSNFDIGTGGGGPQALDTFLHRWAARGPGGAVSYQFGDVVLDVFWGMNPVMCYDLPPIDCPELAHS